VEEPENSRGPAQRKTEAREPLLTGYANDALGVQAAELGGETADLPRCSDRRVYG
jgi:hypothetical protein